MPLRQLAIEHLPWISLHRHTANVTGPAQLVPRNEAFNALKSHSCEHFGVGYFITPCEAQDFLDTAHVEPLQELQVPSIYRYRLDSIKKDTQAYSLVDSSLSGQSQIVAVYDPLSNPV